MEKTRWIVEHGILFPLVGEPVTVPEINGGIWKVVKSPNPMDGRLGLLKMSEEFEFPFKVYDTGANEITQRIIDAWNSSVYKNNQKNLGAIFNGYKGTGKTIAAKLLCNKLGLPVIIVDDGFEGAILSFVQSLQFECVIFFDEAEKTFPGDSGQLLLKLIDGVYNAARKLYILTTNTLSVNENLLGRPGRIRYIKEFGNLPVNTVLEFIEDNLEDKSYKSQVLNQVNQLQLSTIDTLRSIVEEFNIFGNVPKDMNLDRANYSLCTLQIYNYETEKADIYSKDFRKQVLSYIKDACNGETPYNTFFNSPGKDEDKDPEEVVYNKSDHKIAVSTNVMSIKFPFLYKDLETSYGTVIDEPDDDGFFVIKSCYGDTEALYLLLNNRGSSRVYRNLII